MLKSAKKYLLVILGTLSLAFGVTGIFLPLLPTTPFLLLASYCYIRSSKRLYTWLIHHKICGPYIYNYMTHRAVLKKTKIFSLICLWFSLVLSIILINNWYLRAFLMAVGIGVSIHLVKLKTIDETAFFRCGEAVQDDSAI